MPLERIQIADPGGPLSDRVRRGSRPIGCSSRGSVHDATAFRSQATRKISKLPAPDPSRLPFGMPRGWYAVAASSEVGPGEIIRRHYFDRELVLYRTESGLARLVDAFCPHLGAHLGKVGRVKGELLRCGLHGFQFDEGGRCVSTDAGGPAPDYAQLPEWEVREQNGWVLAWFDPDGAPAA